MFAIEMFIIYISLELYK